MGIVVTSQCHCSLCNHRLQSAGFVLDVSLLSRQKGRGQSALTRAQSLWPPDKKGDNKYNTPTVWSLLSAFLGLLLPSSIPQSLPSIVLRSCFQTDRAVQLLLETSADNPSYYCDSLKACLVTTITSSGPSQSTIKLVATNMIANGKLAGMVWPLIVTFTLLCTLKGCMPLCQGLLFLNWIRKTPGLRLLEMHFWCDSSLSWCLIQNTYTQHPCWILSKYSIESMADLQCRNELMCAFVSLYHIATLHPAVLQPEGVQLLCLIDKAADACRYLQTYGEWNRAAWLAKVTQQQCVHQQVSNTFLGQGGLFVCLFSFFQGDMFRCWMGWMLIAPQHSQQFIPFDLWYLWIYYCGFSMCRSAI